MGSVGPMVGVGLLKRNLFTSNQRPTNLTASGDSTAFFGWGLDSLLSRTLFSAGIVLALFGVLHLVLAWGLFEREPWARFLGLALGFLALLRFPLGTALGIYTLWVLLPESSGSEYERLAQGGGQLGSASVSS